jgi:predicted nucleotidyltransferase
MVKYGLRDILLQAEDIAETIKWEETLYMDLYMEFIHALSQRLPCFKAIENVVCVYLGGSVSRGDYIVNASDIDLYVVYKEDYETFMTDLSAQILDIAKLHLKELLSWCPDGVSIAYTRYTDVVNGTSWLACGAEYYSFTESSKLLYGKNIYQDIRKPEEKDIIKMAKEGLEYLQSLAQQDIPTDENQDIPVELSSRNSVRGIFSMVFSAIHFKLSMKSIYVRQKELMIDEINKDDKVIGGKLREIYSIWISFGENDLSNKEIIYLLSLVKEVILAL